MPRVSACAKPGAAHLGLRPPRDHLTDAVRDTDDERVAHAEGALLVGHADVRPTLRETLQLVELVRHQAPVLAILRLDDMRAPGR